MKLERGGGDHDIVIRITRDESFEQTEPSSSATPRSKARPI